MPACCLDLRPHDIDRFLSIIRQIQRPNDCWIWPSNKNPKGYGLFHIKRRKENSRLCYSAHRIMFFLTHGSLPEDLQICHRCDNPSCVCPDHLFAGTSHDNHLDMISKGRSLTGSRNPRFGIRILGEDHSSAKLTEAAVREIRSSYRPFVVTRPQLAEKFKVSRATIDLILARKIWSHI